MLNEFKKFMMRGNVLDLAVGIIIGAAFGTVVSSLVNDIIMPPIGLALGRVDFANLFLVLKQGAIEPAPYATVAAAKDAGAVTLNYGLFINALVMFVIVGFAVFLVIRAANRLQGPTPAAAPTTKLCPECQMPIPLAARRCPHCTSEMVR